jgi:hypothetical protein
MGLSWIDEMRRWFDLLLPRRFRRADSCRQDFTSSDVGVNFLIR